jgi:hypothetical protein
VATSHTVVTFWVLRNSVSLYFVLCAVSSNLLQQAKRVGPTVGTFRFYCLFFSSFTQNWSWIWFLYAACVGAVELVTSFGKDCCVKSRQGTRVSNVGLLRLVLALLSSPGVGCVHSSARLSILLILQCSWLQERYFSPKMRLNVRWEQIRTLPQNVFPWRRFLLTILAKTIDQASLT